MILDDITAIIEKHKEVAAQKVSEYMAKNNHVQADIWIARGNALEDILKETKNAPTIMPVYEHGDVVVGILGDDNIGKVFTVDCMEFDPNRAPQTLVWVINIATKERIRHYPNHVVLCYPTPTLPQEEYESENDSGIELL